MKLSFICIPVLATIPGAWSVLASEGEKVEASDMGSKCAQSDQGVSLLMTRVRMSITNQREEEEEQAFAPSNYGVVAATGEGMMCKDDHGQTMQLPHNKELANTDTLAQCYTAAEADPECVTQATGVIYALKANDPSGLSAPADPGREGRCICLKMSAAACQGGNGFYPTDAIFQRYMKFQEFSIAAATGQGMMCKDDHGQTMQLPHNKELANTDTLAQCYTAAEADSDCVTQATGVIYALKANDPSGLSAPVDPGREGRCICLKMSAAACQVGNGFYPTDAIFQRYMKG